MLVEKRDRFREFGKWWYAKDDEPKSIHRNRATFVKFNAISINHNNNDFVVYKRRRANQNATEADDSLLFVPKCEK